MALTGKGGGAVGGLFQRGLSAGLGEGGTYVAPVSYTHLRAHETVLDLVCRLLLEKKNSKTHQR